MCQFTQLEKEEPQDIFAEKECRILQELLANITATDQNINEINTFLAFCEKWSCQKSTVGY